MACDICKGAGVVTLLVSQVECDCVKSAHETSDTLKRTDVGEDMLRSYFKQPRKMGLQEKAERMADHLASRFCLDVKCDYNHFGEFFEFPIKISKRRMCVVCFSEEELEKNSIGMLYRMMVDKLLKLLRN